MITGVLSLILLSGSHFVSAETFHCASGDVECLVNSLTLANATGKREVIKLAGGTYTLVSVDNNTDGPNLLPSIIGNITIQGAGADRTIITSDLTPEGGGVRTFHVAEVGTLKLAGLTVVEGGSGIRNKGAVTMRDVTISDNHQGPGILNDQTGLINMKHSTVSNNGFFMGSGGGIVNNGTMEVTGSNITGNGQELNGGIENGGRMTIKNSTIANNRADFGAGGIGNGINAWMEIINCLVLNNSAENAGGIDNRGEMIIRRSTITANEAREFLGNGGGILNGNLLTIIHTVIANNQAGGRGGGIFNFGGEITMERSVVARNEAGQVGGGIMNVNNGLLILKKSTVTNNVPNDCVGCP